MSRRAKWYTVLALLLIVGIVSFTIYYVNKGAPAVSTDDYTQSSQEPAETDLKVMQGGAHPVAGMQLVAKTAQLEMYLNAETTEVAVVDVKSGKVWRTNPEERNDDVKAAPFEKEHMSSQLTITFRDDKRKLNTFANFTESVARQQFDIKSIENGIRINYILGDNSLGVEALPKLISVKRMKEKVLDQLDEATARFVSTKYYPLKENKDVLERLDAAVSRQLVLGRMIDAFEKAGYTPDDHAFDNEENGISGVAASDKPNFTVPLEYRLEGDSLLVSVPVDQIKESDGYQLRSLNLLEFFGAAGLDEQGYMFVPDGSGSLIHLNNGKFKGEIYAQRFYGKDENDNSYRRGQVAESARLPVFGLKSGDNAWLAEVVSGDGIASVNADVSGRNNNYNYLYTSYALRGEDWLELYKGAQVEEIQLLTEQRYKGDVAVRYRFLSGSDANYAGMAKLYREQLIARGALQPVADGQDLPFFVSMLGDVDMRKTILGVPYKGMIAMTTFDQAGDIVDKLYKDGVHNVQMRYLGWFNKGINHQIPATIKLDSTVGNLKEMQQLAKKLADNGGRLYPDVAFQHVYANSIHFAPASDAARFVTREQAELTPYNRAFNSMDYDLGIFWLLSPTKLPYFVDQFIDKYRKVGLDSVSLRDLGDLLHADYRVSRPVFRDTAKAIVTEQLSKIDKAYPHVLVSGGNAYAFPYADSIVDAPMGSSFFNITDEAVPFYQMVLHGYIDYAGPSINLNDRQSIDQQLLQAVELGAAPQFTWSAQSSSKLKFTKYDVYFATEYTNWYDSAVAAYKKANDVLGKLRSSVMVERSVPEAGVVAVKYDNGTTVYVNYNDKPVTVNGVTIEAQNFTTGGGNK